MVWYKISTWGKTPQKGTIFLKPSEAGQVKPTPGGIGVSIPEKSTGTTTGERIPSGYGGYGGYRGYGWYGGYGGYNGYYGYRPYTYPYYGGYNYSPWYSYMYPSYWGGIW